MESFVDPGVSVVFPVNDILSEPEFDFLLSVLSWVGAVADVSSGNNAEITSDCSGVWGKGVSGTEKHSSGGNNSDSFPAHADNGAWEHIGDKSREEGSLGKIGIVLLKKFFRGCHHLKGSEVVSLLFESGDDVSNESSLDTVGLDHDVGLFHCCWIRFIKLIWYSQHF